ncbi:acetyl-CoA carboxylase biotin carboxyl carrier protein [Helicobacter vulpis]|uniref:acetyl-CoA carboxylase biotin carboxyl carrier protein n=1 Tax=Helicobacter vulpis TaxID=2316076 RepID=UPI000EAD3289|nr:acetyl-CoA carboxylase biotin carboxyl carrier protein [Helicobacter vulpis]
MNISDIQSLVSCFDQSGVHYMKLKIENLELILDKGSKKAPIPLETPPVQPPLPTPLLQSPTASACALSPTTGTSGVCDNTKQDYILSPMVGTFYRCPAPGASPYVNPGDTIKKGQTIGIVEAMKIMNEIEAECDCRILSVEVEDASAVEYGTQLVRIEKL